MSNSWVPPQFRQGEKKRTKSLSPKRKNKKIYWGHGINMDTPGSLVLYDHPDGIGVIKNTVAAQYHELKSNQEVFRKPFPPNPNRPKKYSMQLQTLSITPTHTHTDLSSQFQVPYFDDFSPNTSTQMGSNLNTTTTYSSCYADSLQPQFTEIANPFPNESNEFGGTSGTFSQVQMPYASDPITSSEGGPSTSSPFDYSQFLAKFLKSPLNTDTSFVPDMNYQSQVSNYNEQTANLSSQTGTSLNVPVAFSSVSPDALESLALVSTNLKTDTSKLKHQRMRLPDGTIESIHTWPIPTEAEAFADHPDINVNYENFLKSRKLLNSSPEFDAVSIPFEDATLSTGGNSQIQPNKRVYEEIETRPLCHYPPIRRIRTGLRSDGPVYQQNELSNKASSRKHQ